jgi:hypothetical protein
VVRNKRSGRRNVCCGGMRGCWRVLWWNVGVLASARHDRSDSRAGRPLGQGGGGSSRGGTGSAPTPPCRRWGRRRATRHSCAGLRPQSTRSRAVLISTLTATRWDTWQARADSDTMGHVAGAWVLTATRWDTWQARGRSVRLRARCVMEVMTSRAPFDVGERRSRTDDKGDVALLVHPPRQVLWVGGAAQRPNESDDGRVHECV